VKRAFTLIELLVVLAITGLLAALILPALRNARESARAVQCSSNLHQLGLATHLYLDDYGCYFPYFTTAGADRQWYFGLESPYNPNAAPAARHIDLTKAKLYPYFRQLPGVGLCPSYDYRSSRWRQKFDQLTSGYGLNVELFGRRPSEMTNSTAGVVCFADAANINTIQPPASSANPMLEEFYFVHGDPVKFGAPTTQFRHNGRANVLFCDGHILPLPMAPGTLDSRLPQANVGRLNPTGNTTLFW